MRKIIPGVVSGWLKVPQRAHAQTCQEQINAEPKIELRGKVLALIITQ